MAAEAATDAQAGSAAAILTRFGLLTSGPIGAAETLLFLHGWAGSKELWRHTLALMPPGCRVYRPGPAGDGQNAAAAGDADHPADGPLGSPPSAPGLDLSNITLIGHSLGGNLAAEICLLYPKLVRRLVLADAALDPASLPIRARWPLRRPFGLAALAALRISMAPLALWGYFVPTERQVGLWHGQARRCYWYAKANPDDRVLRVQLQALSDNPMLAERLQGLSLPILILHGERDPLVPVSQAHALDENPLPCASW